MWRSRCRPSVSTPLTSALVFSAAGGRQSQLSTLQTLVGGNAGRSPCAATPICERGSCERESCRCDVQDRLGGEVGRQENDEHQTDGQGDEVPPEPEVPQEPVFHSFRNSRNLGGASWPISASPRNHRRRSATPRTNSVSSEFRAASIRPAAASVAVSHPLAGVR